MVATAGTAAFLRAPFAEASMADEPPYAWVVVWAAFVAMAVIFGVAYSFAFTGGLGLVNRAAPAHHRGATLSLLYLFAYLLQALTAVASPACSRSSTMRPSCKRTTRRQSSAIAVS